MMRDHVLMKDSPRWGANDMKNRQTMGFTAHDAIDGA
jgi:hypothetical protein